MGKTMCVGLAMLLFVFVAVTTVSRADDENIEKLRAIVTQAFMGVGPDGETTIYIGNNDDGSFMTVVFMSADTTESAAFAGSAERDDDMVVLHDQIAGEPLEITISEIGDSHMVLDFYGHEFTVGAVDPEDLLEAFAAIDEGTTMVN